MNTMKCQMIVMLMTAVLFGFSNFAQATGKTILSVDAPRFIRPESDSVLVVDSNGKLHATYGYDHLYYAQYDGAAWLTQVVDSSLEVGRYASIAVGSDNKIFITYFDYSNHDLKLATSTDAGQSWSISTILDTVYTTSRMSLQTDPGGVLHLFYYDTTIKAVRYLKSIDSGVNWTASTAYATVNTGQYLSSQVTAAGAIHVSYYDAVTADLIYLYSADGVSWTATTLDSTNSVGQYSSLSIDTTGNIFIAYYDLTRKYLKVAKYDAVSAAWSTKDIVNGRISHVASAVKSDGSIHVCYNHTTLKCVNSSNLGSTWSAASAASSYGAWYTHLVADATGNLHLVFFNSTNSQLIYNQSTNGTVWTAAVIDESGDVGRYSTIKHSDSGRIHAFYYDSVQNTQKYAYSDDQYNWHIKSISLDGDYSVGEEYDFDLDSSGKVHLIFNDSETDSLSYVTTVDGVTWSSVNVISTDTPGYISAKLDDENGIHAAYINDAGALIYVSSSDGQNWDEQTIDDTSTELADLAIFVDAQKDIHIVYRNYSNGEYKYASTDDVGKWSVSIIDSTNNYGSESSIVVNEAGHIFLFSQDTDDGDVNLVLLKSIDDGLNWSATIVDESSDYIGQYSSAFIDAEGRIHFSYFDNSRSAVKYGWTVDGTSFETETASVENEESGLYATSITGNDKGEVFISYYNSSKFDFEVVRISDCGDGIQDSGEECDDGNSVQSDACSNTCQSDKTWYRDLDGDGQGISTDSQSAFDQPSGYVISDTDCNDADVSVYQGAADACGDGVDQDCDGQDVSCPVEIESATIIQNEVSDSDASDDANENVTDGVDNAASTPKSGSGAASGCSLTDVTVVSSSAGILGAFALGVIALMVGRRHALAKSRIRTNRKR